MFSFGQSIVTGFTTNCPESAATVLARPPEIGPTYFFAPPRIWENILTSVDGAHRRRRLAQAAHGPLLPRRGPARGAAAARRRAARARRRPRCCTRSGGVLVYGPLRDNLGMRRIRVAYTAGEAHRPRDLRVLPLARRQREAALRHDGVERARSASSGTATSSSTRWARRCPASSCGSARRARCCTGARASSSGYYKNPEADAGDARGRLGPLGRRRRHRPGRAPRASSTAPGTWAGSPTARSSRPSTSRTSSSSRPTSRRRCAWATGAAVRRRARQHRPGVGGQLGRAARPRLHELHGPRPEARGLRADPRGGRAGEPEPPRRAELAGRRSGASCVLHKELDADDQEITRTRKVRRGFIAEKYAPLIDALYSDERRRDGGGAR